MLFNGHDLNEYVKIEDVRRNLLPPFSPKLKTIPGRVGAKYAGAEIGARNIEADVRIIAKSKEEVLERANNLAGILYVTEPKKLEMQEEGIFYNAIPNGDVNFDRLLYTSFSTISFLCPDPLGYSITPTTYTNIHSKALQNQGTADATGQITITMTDASFLKVTLQNTGEFLYLEDNFIDGDEILIDLEQEFVKKNGNLIMNKLYYESDFFKIPRGDFKITLSGGVGDLEFRKRWL